MIWICGARHDYTNGSIARPKTTERRNQMNYTEKNIDGKAWIYDENNNRASIEMWGSKENAVESLGSLTDCHRCSDCYNCYNCFNFYDCTRSKLSKNKPYPKIENIHKSVLEACSAEDALNMLDWHTCETMHCRAGWVVTLAGEEGKKLENETSTLFASMMIYKASSDIRVSPTEYFKTNDEAMADMKRCAELEQLSA